MCSLTVLFVVCVDVWLSNVCTCVCQCTWMHVYMKLKCSCMCMWMKVKKCLCIHVYTKSKCLYICMHEDQGQVFMHLHEVKGQRNTLLPSLITSQLISLTQYLSLTSQTTDLARPVRSRDPPISASLFLVLQIKSKPGVLCGSWKSGHRSSCLYGKYFLDWLYNNYLLPMLKITFHSVKRKSG